MSKVSEYKRCKCRENGRELGQQCPQLKRADESWNPHHGTWYGKAELPPAPDGARIFLRAGGFGTKDEMLAWFTEALALMSIPEDGVAGHEARAEIRQMILDARKARHSLPDHDDIRRRYTIGSAFRPGLTGEYLAEWIARHKQAEDWAPSTMKISQDVTDRLLLPAIGHLPIDKVRTSHVLAILAGLDADAERIRAARESDDPEVRASVKGRRPPGLSTKKRYLAVLRSALAEATGPGRLITVNPADIKLGRTGKKAKASHSRARLWTAERERKWRKAYQAGLPECTTKAQRFALWRRQPLRPGPVMIWTPAQLGAFLDFAEDDRLYSLLCVVAHCGLRRGEAAGLRWEDTDLAGTSIMVANQIVQVGWRTVQSEPKTAASEASVRLDEVSLEALRAWRRQQLRERVNWGEAWTDTGLVFTREDGTAWHPARITALFERLAFAGGLPPIRFHDLRHGAATLALAGGASMKEVSAMLRHSSEQITSDIYAEVLPELKAEVAAKVVSMVPRRRAAAGGAPGGWSPLGLPEQD